MNKITHSKIYKMFSNFIERSIHKKHLKKELNSIMTSKIKSLHKNFKLKDRS